MGRVEANIVYTEYTGFQRARRSIAMVVVCLGKQRGTWQVESAVVVGDVANTSIGLVAHCTEGNYYRSPNWGLVLMFSSGLVGQPWLHRFKASPVVMAPRSLIISWSLAR
jgi:hypothetical protein